MLPPLIAGREHACFAVTEPNTGLDTTHLKTRAERRGDRYIVNGAEDLDLDGAGGGEDAAPRPHDAARRRAKADRRLEPVLHRARSSSCRSARDREDGPQGRRLQSAVHRQSRSPRRGSHRRGREGLPLHPARHESRSASSIAAEAIGLGRAALKRAAAYAKERVVFGRPIGQNQAIQHPLARMLDGARSRRARWR